VSSENGYGFLRPCLKTGVENGIFRSEIGSGFGDAGGSPPSKISTSTPPPRGACEGVYSDEIVCPWARGKIVR